MPRNDVFGVGLFRLKDSHAQKRCVQSWTLQTTGLPCLEMTCQVLDSSGWRGHWIICFLCLFEKLYLKGPPSQHTRQSITMCRLPMVVLSTDIEQKYFFFCFKFDLLRVQPSWCTLYQSKKKKKKKRWAHDTVYTSTTNASPTQDIINLVQWECLKACFYVFETWVKKSLTNQTTN